MIIEKILLKLTPIFCDVLDEPNLILTEELSANDVITWDSLSHITLIVEIEALTGLSLTTDDLASLRNVGDFARMLAEKGFHG